MRTVIDSDIVLDFVNSKHLTVQTLLLYMLARHFYMVDNVGMHYVFWPTIKVSKSPTRIILLFYMS